MYHYEGALCIHLIMKLSISYTIRPIQFDYKQTSLNSLLVYQGEQHSYPLTFEKGKKNTFGEIFSLDMNTPQQFTRTVNEQTLRRSWASLMVFPFFFFCHSNPSLRKYRSTLRLKRNQEPPAGFKLAHLITFRAKATKHKR